ncbi:MAG: carboxy terminal-processing peptidase [Steroidobacteraceae bacterium]
MFLNRHRPLRSAQRHSMLLGVAVLTLTTLTASGSSNAPAITGVLPTGAIQPTTRQRQLAPRIAGILEQGHYRQLKIDDAFSAQVLERYLDELDAQHSYLLASDIASFDHWRTRFDDMIHTGLVEPAYLIFNTLQQRNKERIQYALQLLDKEPDWSRDESYTFDRSKAPWPKNEAELNEIWRLRVKSDALTLMLGGKSWSEAADTLKKRYQRVLARVDQVSSDDVFEMLMNAYTSVYDPHSSFFSPRNSEQYRIQMSLSYEGIGASLQSVDDYVTITDLLTGGAAAAAGTLKINDRITAVGQGNEGPLVDVIGWRLDDVVQLIRGKGGTAVRLQILPAGAAPGTPEKVIELVRAKIQLDSGAAKKEVREIERDGRKLKVGVITVPGFYQDIAASSAGDKDFRSTTRDVLKLLKEMESSGGIDALVLDLRGDGGGYLPEATALTGLFIDRGPVVQIKDSSGRTEVLEDPEPGVAYDGPLTVLIDRTSASASEIFAGAIQDYHRGLILGQTSFGKGTVQSLVPLSRTSDAPGDGQITVTIGKFYRVTGESTQLHGVEPDITLPSSIDARDVGESSLVFPMPWDRVAAANFTAQAPITGAVATLQANEAQRVQGNADYLWFTQTLALLDSTRQEKSQSLNLEKRRIERAAQESSRLDQENARRKADGVEAVKTLEDIVPAQQPDVVLEQAAQITADYAMLGATDKTLSQAPRLSEPMVSNALQRSTAR